jgi:uncharacterized protein YigE (DUF2233 family)
MNAGMFQPNFSPVGLFVAGGRELAPLNTNSGYGNFFMKPNGIFVMTEMGPRVVETSEYPKVKGRIVLATQSGPLLVHSGKIHPVFKHELHVTSDSQRRWRVERRQSCIRD